MRESRLSRSRAATPAQMAASQPAPPALEAALAALGPFGLYQGYALLLLCAPNLLAPMYALNYVFVADHVPFRCAVPECEGAAPWQFGHAGAAALLAAAPACRRPAPANTTPPAPDQALCTPHDYLTETVSCEHYVYETKDTTFAEFDLGCREWLRTMVGTVRNAALPFALLLSGYVADTFGRLRAFCIFSGCMGALGIVKALSVNYAMYLSMEFLEAALGYGFTGAAYVLMIELASPGARAWFACASGAAYGVGGMLLAALAWRVRYWRRLLLLAHGAALLLPLYGLLLQESARWLHARGRGERAAAVLRRAARWNKAPLDEELLRRVVAEAGSDAGATGEGKAGSIREVVRSRALLARLALVSGSWVAVAFVYYGLTINSVALAGDKYANFALNMAMEVAASLLLAMALERLGRRRAVCAAFALCGAACVTPFFLTSSGAQLGLFFVGKLAITFAFNGMYVFTTELFPTRVRSSALAACSLVGRLGSLLAPQTPLLDTWVQAMLYGACSGLGALCVLLAPETRHAPLPDGSKQAEALSRTPQQPDPTAA